jgi:hypothetical protein
MSETWGGGRSASPTAEPSFATRTRTIRLLSAIFIVAMAIAFLILTQAAVLWPVGFAFAALVGLFAPEIIEIATRPEDQIRPVSPASGYSFPMLEEARREAALREAAAREATTREAALAAEAAAAEAEAAARDAAARTLAAQQSAEAATRASQAAADRIELMLHELTEMGLRVADLEVARPTLAPAAAMIPATADVVTRTVIRANAIPAPRLAVLVGGQHE